MNKENIFKTSDVKAIYGVESWTVIRWADDFKAYLTKGACPDKPNTPRFFTYEDVEKLALIHEMRKVHRPTAEISAALAKGEKGIPPDDVNALVYVGNPNTPLALQERVKKLTAMLLEKDQMLKTANSNIENLERDRESLRRELRDAYIQIGNLQSRLNQK